MLKIKLFPKGKKHQRTFRVVVAEARSKFNGKVVADIGFITPHTKTVQIDKAQLAEWIKKGAQLTLGVDKLVNPDKFPKKVKVKPVKEVKEEVKEAVKPVEVEKTEEVAEVEAPTEVTPTEETSNE